MAKKKKKPAQPSGGGVGNTGPRKVLKYNLTIDNDNSTGTFRFEFRTYDAAGKTYYLDAHAIDDRADLVKRIIEVIGRAWPNQELFCHVDENDVITNVSDTDAPLVLGG